MTSTTQPIRVGNPVAATYDQGTDIQPAVSWSKPNTDSYPKTSTTSTTTTTTTQVKSSNPSTSFTDTALAKNLNPIDKEDPRRNTKVLPFADSSTDDIASTVVTPAVDDSDYALHNGNILDRTMDQIRTWVHSFQQKAHDEYEEYVEEEGEEGSSKTGGMSQTAANTVQSAKAKVGQLAQQTSSTLHQYTAVASDRANQVSSTVKQQLHSVQDQASATVQQVKTQVNEFIHSHQSQPGEPLTSTLTHSLTQQLPSQGAVKEKVSAILPPLAQQASSSYAFLGSFVTQYLSTYRDFLLALRRQSLPLQMMTGLLFITHLVLPLFFFDKGPARSVIYCYIVSSILSHATFFLSGHLRYMFLAHLVFIPMLISLTLHAGFGEAGRAVQASSEYSEGETLKAMLIAPLSLRSYLFVLWLRVVLMVQASLLTLDVVNVLDLLGFSLETRRGQEMALINRSVAQMRRNFAHSVAPPPTSRAAKSTTTTTTSSSTSSPSSSQSSGSEVLVQSHEKPSTASSEGLRERKPQIHYSVNNQPI